MTVEYPLGAELDVVLKVTSAELTIEGLANELLAAFIAGTLGLPVPEPLLVEIDSDFADAAPTDDLRARLLANGPLAFGSANAGTQWRDWERFDKVAPAQLPLALAVIAFDAFIGNNDRRPRNPNLLVRGGEWRLIDHADAFQFRLKLFPPCAPWLVGNLNMLRGPGEGEHLLFRALSGTAINLEPVHGAWLGLSEDILAQYLAFQPPEWVDAAPFIQTAVDHLSEVRDRIDPCLTELARVLA